MNNQNRGIKNLERAENNYNKKRCSGQSVSWKDIYESEEELINTMMNTSENVSGNQFINSFKKQVLSGKELSKSQMTQLKRLGRFIFEDVYLNPFNR